MSEQHGKISAKQLGILSRSKAIRAKCLDCMGGQLKEVRLCPSRDCALWPYRMGNVSRGVFDEQNVDYASQNELPG